jgi:hypothetical protein
MKRQGSNELPRFAVGALAIAGASAANAATVQITFDNSFISSTSGNQLDTDFGGDSVSDIVGDRRISFAGVGHTTFGGPMARYHRVALGMKGSAGGMYYESGFAYVNKGNFVVGAVAIQRALVPFTLTDGAVRGGAPTAGWLDVTATGRSAGELGRVDVHRFIFDDTGLGAPTGVAHADAAYPEYGAVPEPSGLGLLALGAGGLLARRRRAA